MPSTPTPRTIKAQFPSQQMPDVVRSMAHLWDEPLAGVTVTPAESTAASRLVTIQVVDRLGEPWKGLWLLTVYLSDTAGGAPAVTGSPSTTVDLGETLYVDNYVRILVTDTAGKVRLSLDDAGTFVVNVAMPLRLSASAEIEVT